MTQSLKIITIALFLAANYAPMGSAMPRHGNDRCANEFNLNQASCDNNLANNYESCERRHLSGPEFRREARQCRPLFGRGNCHNFNERRARYESCKNISFHGWARCMNTIRRIYRTCALETAVEDCGGRPGRPGRG